MIVVRSSRGEASLSVPTGGRVLDACDERTGLVSFSCRGGSCGTCRVEVEEGGHLLSPRTRDEDETLEFFGDPDTVRLACQVRVRGAGLVRLRVVEDA